MKQKLFYFLVVVVLLIGMMGCGKKKNDAEVLVPDNIEKEFDSVEESMDSIIEGEEAMAGEMGSEAIDEEEAEFYNAFMFFVLDNIVEISDDEYSGDLVEHAFINYNPGNWDRDNARAFVSAIKNNQQKIDYHQVEEYIGMAYEYPDIIKCRQPWGSIYLEYKEKLQSFSGSIDSTDEHFGSMSVFENVVLYEQDDVKFILENSRINDNKEMVLSFSIANNNQDNKKAIINPQNFYINGVILEGNSMSTMIPREILAGDVCEFEEKLYMENIDRLLSDYGETFSTTPVETLGIFFSAQVGSSSDEEYYNYEIKTDYYDNPFKMYGEHFGTFDLSCVDMNNHQEIKPVDFYRKDLEDGIVITIYVDGMYRTDLPKVFIGKTIDNPISCPSRFGRTITIMIENTEDELRKKYEISNSEPLELNLRFNGDIRIML